MTRDVSAWTRNIVHRFCLGEELLVQHACALMAEELKLSTSHIYCFWATHGFEPFPHK